MSFGENLRKLLEERELTQKELANRLNIAPSTMSSYVQNAREPDFATLKAIAKYFGVSIDYLLDHPSEKSQKRQEGELLRVFSELSPEQRDIVIEQMKVVVKANNKNGK